MSWVNYEMNWNDVQWCLLMNSYKQWIIKQITRNWKEDALNLDNAEVTVPNTKRLPTSRGTTFVNCKPASQYNFMYCWQACLPNFVQAIHFHFNTFYSISLISPFFTSFIFMPDICHTLGAISFFPSVAFVPVVPVLPLFRSSCINCGSTVVVSMVSSKLALAKAVAAVAHERKAAMAILSPAATGGWKLKGRAPPPKIPRSIEPSGIKWNQSIT